MSEGDIEKAVKEAAEYEAQDKKRKEAIDTRNEADSFVFQTEKALEDVGDKIPEADKASVQADLAALKTLLDQTKDQEMTESQVYEQAQAAGGAAGAGPDMGGAAGNAGSAPDDDVIDGDFREV